MSDDLSARLTLALDTESPTPAVYTEVIGDLPGLWAWLRSLDPSLPAAPPAMPPDTLGQNQPTVRATARLTLDGHGVVSLQCAVVLAPAAVERARDLIPMLRTFGTLARGLTGSSEPAPALAAALAQCEVHDDETGARCDLDPGHAGEHVWDPDELSALAAVPAEMRPQDEAEALGFKLGAKLGAGLAKAGK